MNIEDVWNQLKVSGAFRQGMEQMQEALNRDRPSMIVGESVIANFSASLEDGGRHDTNLSVCVTKGVGTYIITPVFAGIPITNMKPAVIADDLYDSSENKAEREANGLADS